MRPARQRARGRASQGHRGERVSGGPVRTEFPGSPASPTQTPTPAQAHPEGQAVFLGAASVGSPPWALNLSGSVSAGWRGWKTTAAPGRFKISSPRVRGRGIARAGLYPGSWGRCAGGGGACAAAWALVARGGREPRGGGGAVPPAPRWALSANERRPHAAAAARGEAAADKCY